jgi:hypothetical protein
MGVKISTADDDVRREARRGKEMDKLCSDARLYMLRGFKDPIAEMFVIRDQYEAERDDLRAEVADLRTKLAAANAELHALRIKCGLA